MFFNDQVPILCQIDDANRCEKGSAVLGNYVASCAARAKKLQEVFQSESLACLVIVKHLLCLLAVISFISGVIL